MVITTPALPTYSGPVIKMSEIVGGGYDEFWHTKCMYRMCKGSKGSKKSKTAALWYIKHMMEYPEANTLVIRKVFSTLKDSAYTELLWAIDRLGVTDAWDASVSPLKLTIKATGQVILFRGMDDAQKIASINVRHGYLCWVWFEEFFEITNEEEFNKVTMSIRGNLPPETGLWKQFTGTFNPWSEHTWIKARFFDTKSPNIYACTTTFRDNEFLGEDDIERYMELYKTNPRAARIICDGEWGIAEGLVYENWHEEVFEIDDVLKEYPYARPMFGLDFGFSISYSAFVAALIDTKNHKLWIFDEMYERHISNLEIAKRITKMGYGKEVIIADSAGAMNIFEIEEGQAEIEIDDNGKEQIRVWSLPNIRPSYKGGDNTVRNGIRRLQSYEMIVHPSCVNMIIELRNYCFDQDVDGNWLDKPIKDFDHLCDALRYASERYFVTSKGHVVEAKGGAAKSGVKSKRVVSSTI